MELKSNQPGYFEIFEGAMDSGWFFMCQCPCGCRYPDVVPIHKKGDPPHWDKGAWEWDGNLTHPTLSPSLRRRTPCRIHFNVTAGVYIIHDDGAPAASNIYKAP